MAHKLARAVVDAAGAAVHLIVLILLVIVEDRLFDLHSLVIVIVLAGGTGVPSHSAGDEILLDKAPAPGQVLGFRMGVPSGSGHGAAVGAVSQS